MSLHPLNYIKLCILNRKSKVCTSVISVLYNFQVNVQILAIIPKCYCLNNMNLSVFYLNVMFTIMTCLYVALLLFALIICSNSIASHLNFCLCYITTIFFSKTIRGSAACLQAASDCS